MQVYFTPEQEAQLHQLAGDKGTAAEELVKQAALHLLDVDPLLLQVCVEELHKRMPEHLWITMRLWRNFINLSSPDEAAMDTRSRRKPCFHL